MNPLPHRSPGNAEPQLGASSSAVRAGAILGFAAMALIGWKMAGQPSPPPTSAPQENASTTKPRPTRVARNSGPPDAVRQRMTSLRAITSPQERMRATIDLAYHLPVSEIEGWMEGRWFNTGGGFDLTLFNKILTERWQKEDPEGILLWKIKNNGGSTGELLANWAETEPERAAAFLKNLPDKNLQLQALSQIARKNPALALQCLRDLPPSSTSGDGSGSYYNRQTLLELAKSSPAELQAALSSLPANLKSQAESILIGQRLQTSFTAEFQQLLDRPDGWKIVSENLSTVKDLKGKILDQLADLPTGWKASIASSSSSLIDAANASKWWDADLEGMGFTDRDAKRIRTTALGRLSSQQPEQALKLMATSEMDASSRSSVISNLFHNLKPDAENGESLIALLGSDGEKDQARQIIESNRSPSPSEQKIEKPADWLATVAADPKPNNSYQYLSMLRQWEPEKIAELGNQFRAMPDDSKKQVAQLIASNSGSRSLGPELVGDAIRYLVAQPPPTEEEKQTGSHNTIAQASYFAVNWSKSDPAAASAWVQSLPSGDAKLWAQKNLAATWSQYDPQEAGQWVKSLPAKDRTEVENFMKTGGKLAREP